MSRIIALSVALFAVALPSSSSGVPPDDYPVDALRVAHNVIVSAIAVRQFTGEIEKDQNNADAFFGRGVAFQEMDKFDNAIADFNEAIRLNPRHGGAHVGRATTWSIKGEPEKAIADYNEALRLNPKDAAAFSGMGIALHAQREFDKAIAKFDEATQIDPEFIGAIECRGAAWLAKGNLVKAMADLDEAIRLNPKSAFAHSCRGTTLQAEGKLQEAIADFDKAIQLNPKCRWAYQLRAWLRATCPDKNIREGNSAIADAGKVLEMTTGMDAGDLDTLAAACAEAGKFGEAIEAQEEALRHAPQLKKEKFQDRLRLYLARTPYREEPKRR